MTGCHPLLMPAHRTLEPTVLGLNRLFTVEGVGVGGVSCGGVGRGPLMMGVPAPPVQKTSACLALPSAVPM